MRYSVIETTEYPPVKLKGFVIEASSVLEAALSFADGTSRTVYFREGYKTARVVNVAGDLTSRSFTIVPAWYSKAKWEAI